MLIDFSFSNFASYLGTANFSMEASKYVKDYNGLNTFSAKDTELIKSAFIFGANASGKTNIIKAVSFMKSMVLSSFENENILKSTNKFMFSTESRNIPSSFEIIFIVSEDEEEVSYRYGFEICFERITKEWLYRKLKKEVCIFERNDQLPEKIVIYGNESKKAKLVSKEYTRDNALFISTAYKFNILFAKVIRQWFERVEIINFQTSTIETAELIKNEESRYKPLILSYLKQADFGISDISVDIEESEINSAEDLVLQTLALRMHLPDGFKSEEMLPSKITRKSIDIKSKHKTFNSDKELVGEKLVSFTQFQSQGTIKFFELIGPFINALINKKIIFVDEIDSRLHCAIVKFLVSMFNSIDINTDNAQLIATTHDVLLLEEKIRRDQIWFAQKNEYGESELYCLSDFKGVRKKDLILKKYLMGQFGAIPFMGRK